MADKKIKNAFAAIRPEPGAMERMQRSIERELGGPMSQVSVQVRPRQNRLPAILTAAAALLLILGSAALLLWPQLRPRQTEPPAPLTGVEQPGYEAPAPTPEPGSADPEPFDPEYLPLYQSVLDEYRAVLERADVEALGDTSILLRHYFEREPLRRVGWSLTDLNADQVPELLIGSVENEEFYGYILFDVYTLADGAPVRLAQSTERDRFYDVNGELLEESSGSAFDSRWNLWTLSDGTLAFSDGLLCNDNLGGGPWFRVISGGREDDVLGGAMSEDEARDWIERYDMRKLRHSFTPFDPAGRTPEPTPEQQETVLTAYDDLRIAQMLEALAAVDELGPAAQLSLRQWADQGSDGVVRLCEKLGLYAGHGGLSYTDILRLLSLDQDLDGAEAEAYAALLGRLHELYPAQLTVALSVQLERFQDRVPADLLAFEEPGYSLEEELALIEQIYSNTQSVARLQYGLDYASLAPTAADMQLNYCGFCIYPLREDLIWQVDGAKPVWVVFVPLDSGTAEIYFDRLGAPVAHWYGVEASEHGPAPEWTLQCRVQSSELYETPIPPTLAAALEAKLSLGQPLEGMDTEWVEGWGMRYRAGAEVLPVWLAPGDRQPQYSDCVQRSPEGRYGLNGVEADAEIRAILNWLGQETGWRVHADNTDFADLVRLELWNGDDCVLRVTDGERLAAFEALMQNSLYTVGDAGKTPGERIELRAVTAEGEALTLLLDPESPRLWLPPFGYYRYNAHESTEVQPLLDALGIADWPEALQTVDYALVRESYERAQPRPEDLPGETGREPDKMARIEALIAMAEAADADLKGELQKDLPQTELNLVAKQRYELWDGCLNDAWAVLLEGLSEAEAQHFTEDQRRWLQTRDDAIAELEREYAGGSILGLLVNQAGADLSRERVYALAGLKAPEA